MKIERIRDTDYIIHYPSFADLQNDQPKSVTNSALLRDKDSLTGEQSWFGPGCVSASQFDELVKQGWPSLVAAVKTKAARLAFKPDILPPAITNAMKRRRVRADQGSELDIHRVYQGQLDKAWDTTRRELHHVRRRAAHIYINIGGMGMLDARDSQWRAAAAYRICDILTRSGYAVEITVGATASGVFRGSGRRYLCHTSYTAKASSTPMDLTRLAMQATLGWHRVFNFKARLCNDKGYEVDSGFGSPVQQPSPWIKERGDLVITVPSNTLSEEMAAGVVRLAQQTLEKAGKGVSS